MGFTPERVIFQIILPGLLQTFQMLVLGFVFSVVVGFALGLVLYTTSERGLRPTPVLYRALDAVINVLRSVPFLILMITVMPLSRLIFHTVIGTGPAVFSITIACAPLLARLFEASFREVDPSLIEAAQSFGASRLAITREVIVGESVPALVSNITLGTISILGCSAMAGVVGAGGIGAIALTYGYQNFNDQIMYGTVLILIVLVQLIQYSGDRIYRRVK